MAAAIPQLQYSCDSTEALEGQLCSKGLKVVEIYSEWCGPCKSILPTFRRIRLDKDDEASLTFLTVPAEKCDYLDACKEHRGKSEPLFLLYRNGQMKCKIEGANTPMLAAQIMALCPANADLDDLAENPLYLAKQERERIARGEVVKDAKGAKGRKK